MQARSPVHSGWLFSPDYQPDYCKSSFDDSLWEVVDLPHTNMVLDRHYVDEASFCFVSTYRKTLHMALPKGYTATLRFEGIASQAKVFGDGVLLHTHKGGYLPFEVALGSKATIALTVVVDSREDGGIPPLWR